MTVVAGFNHVAIVTDDLGRLERFYRDVFDVTDSHVMSDGDLRHGFIRVGERSVLHAFQSTHPLPPPGPMFGRGCIDHFALGVDDEAEFERLRSRLVAAGASSGTVTDFGVLLSVGFKDPDGMACELCWFRDDALLADSVDRS